MWVMVRSGACDGVTEGEMRGGREMSIHMANMYDWLALP